MYLHREITQDHDSVDVFVTAQCWCRTEVPVKRQPRCPSLSLQGILSPEQRGQYKVKYNRQYVKDHDPVDP